MKWDNRIKWNLQQISRVASDGEYFRKWGADAIVYYIRSTLEHIEELLQEPEPEPETLAGSVLRLTDTCNALEGENRKLKQELDVTSRSNAYLRGCLNHQRDILACRDQQLAKVHKQLKEALRILKDNSE